MKIFSSYIYIYSVMSIALFSCTWYPEEANIGTTLGALFGGLFLGVILTTVAAIIIYRRSETHVNKRSVVTVEIILKLLLSFVNILEFHRFYRDELTVKFSDNDACCSAKVVDSNALQNIQTKDKKVMMKFCTYNGLSSTSKVNNNSVQTLIIYIFVLHLS